MCLAIPGKILGIEPQDDSIFQIGKVSFSGITKRINLSLVPEAKEGDNPPPKPPQQKKSLGDI